MRGIYLKFGPVDPAFINWGLAFIYEVFLFSFILLSCFIVTVLYLQETGKMVDTYRTII